LLAVVVAVVVQIMLVLAVAVAVVPLKLFHLIALQRVQITQLLLVMVELL
jgi:hypothetical protein